MTEIPAEPQKLLFICSQNKWRSLTAERLFDGHAHYEARSAGTKPGARVRVRVRGTQDNGGSHWLGRGHLRNGAPARR